MDSTPIHSAFAGASHARGVVADVARRLGLSHEHVRQIALGRRKNEKVRRALIEELRKRVRRERAA